MRANRTYKLIGTKDVFTISLIVATLTVLGVYFGGLGRHATFFENSIISTTVLSIAFFSFITIGLFNGIKLKDNLGQIVDRFKSVDTSNVSSALSSGPLDVGDGIAGIILSVLLWIVMAVVFSIALWIFSNVVVVAVLTFISMLYWVFFRALRLVFKNSNRSKGDLLESMKWGLTYTLIYNFWIYGICFLTSYFNG
jgi:ABC-type multidrug transport system fused ATPase/permease subunit